MHGDIDSELAEQLRLIKQGKHAEIALLNDRLQKLDREMADADRHIREQIEAMTSRAEIRRQDIIGGLEELRATLSVTSVPPPLPDRHDAAEIAQRYAPRLPAETFAEEMFTELRRGVN